MMVGGGSGTPAFASLDMAKLDGGADIDTLSFEESTTGGAEINLTRGGAVNFENLIATGSAETVRGDAGNNILQGKGGADTLYGGSGNDTLYAHNNEGSETSDESTNDNLYGEAGDDVLSASDGDNILDGGTGADTIYSGSGVDTIVIRAGDGSSTLASADVITDFEDGADLFGTVIGLVFADLSVEQGTGSNSNDTLVSITATGEYLAIVEGINATALTEADFTPVDIL
jgi:Ca2+-binding RTX toxin-like protein